MSVDPIPPDELAHVDAMLERQGITAADAAELRAFARFLREAGPAPEPETGASQRARDAAVKVYGDEWARGPALPQLWEGDQA